MEQQKPFKILLIGDLCQDVYQFGTVDRISPEAPVPVFIRDHEQTNPGMAGKASVMPAFGKTLGDSDIVAVLAFIKSNWPPDVLSAQERLSEETRHAHH